MIGTAKSLDPSLTGDYMYIFKVQLDATSHAPISTGMKLGKMKDIKKPGYVMAVKPSLVLGDVHLVYTDEGRRVWYMTWDWNNNNKAQAFLLYERIERPIIGAFLGTAFEMDGSNQVFQGYFGTGLKERTHLTDGG